MMRRNLHNRVEVVFPILDGRMQQQVLRILATQLSDNQDAWELSADCAYHHIAPASNEEPTRSQWIFMEDSFGLPEQP